MSNDESLKEEDEISTLKTQLSKLGQQYQSLFQEALAYKDLAYNNALILSNVIRNVTGKLLETDVTKMDENIRNKLMDIVKELNKSQKAVVKEPENNGQQTD